MGMQFIIGGSGSGKSYLLYKSCIEYSIKHPEEQILLIVPEQFTLQTQRDIIHLHPNHGTMNIDILSFERLAYRVFEELGIKQKQVLDDTAKSMILRLLINDSEDELFAFRRHLHKKGFISQMKSAISEMLQYKIAPDELRELYDSLDNETHLQSKLKDIEVIYKKFMDYICEQYMTTEQVLDQLEQVADRSLVIKNRRIYIDNFTGFTPVQMHLMEKILKLSSYILMTITIDARERVNVSGKREELFYLTKDTFARINELCRINHIERLEDLYLNEQGIKYTDAKAIAHLEHELFRKYSLVYPYECEDIQLYCLKNPKEEIEFCIRKIHQLVKNSGFRYKDIGIITNDVERYRRDIKWWCEQYDIPYFLDYRRNIVSNMLIEWIRSLFSMLQSTMSFESVFRFLRAGFSEFSTEDIDQMENYALAFGIQSEYKWKKEWTYTSTCFNEELVYHLNENREKLMTLTNEIRSFMRKKNINVQCFMDVLVRFMESCQIPMFLDKYKQSFESTGDLSRAKEYEQIYRVVIDLIDQMATFIGTENMSLKEISDIFDTGIEELKMTIIPPGIDEMTVGDVRRTRLADIKILFFVGMNDGLVPLITQGNGLLTDSDRMVLSEHEVTLAPTTKDNICIERFYLYAALTKPSRYLYMTYSEQDAIGNELRVSGLIESIRRIFPKLEIKKAEKSIVEHDYRAGYRNLLELLQQSSNKKEWTDQEKQLYQWFEMHQHEERLLEPLLNAAFYHHIAERISKLAVKALYGEQLLGSVSMFEKFAACAYSHFLMYGLRLKERQIYQIKPPDIGTIFHQAIELFSINMARNGYLWKTIESEKRDQLIEDCVKSVALNYQYAVMQDTKRAEYLTEKIIKMAKNTIWVLQKQLQKGDFEPAGYEMKFSVNYSQILNEDIYKIILQGKIDRIDLFEEDDAIFYKVIDYKTGHQAMDYSRIYHGLQMQLMVYMDVLCQNERENNAKKMVIPAGILYYHIQNPVLEKNNFAEFIQDVNEQEKLTNEQIEWLNELKMDGLVLEDQTVLDHMDHHLYTKPQVIPVKLKKDGSLYASSKVISLEGYDKLTDHVKDNIKQFSHEIFSGHIPVNPYIYEDKKACDYCNYKTICGFRNDLRGYQYRHIHQLSKDELFKLLQMEE